MVTSTCPLVRSFTTYTACAAKLALCLSFGAGMCTIGKLSQRAATTGSDGHGCANSDESWLHIDIIHKHGRRGRAVKRGAFSCDSVCCVTRRKKLYVM